MAEKISAILITGQPGTGKTTIIKRLATEIVKKANNKAISGIYTEEVRDENKSRIGFDVISFTGTRDVLARISGLNDTTGVRKPKIGKYNVHIDSFEKVFSEATSEKSQILIIDEIGKMELLSRKFEQDMKKLLLEVNNGSINLIATVPCNHTIKLIEQFKSAKYAKLFEITKSNRNVIYKEIEQYCFEMLLNI